MKLKKIASLALAGIMAVSMLAGCKGETEPTEPENPVVPSASGVASYLNDMLTSDQRKKISFEDDSTLRANTLAIATDSNVVTPTKITTATTTASADASVTKKVVDEYASGSFATTDWDNWANGTPAGNDGVDYYLATYVLDGDMTEVNVADAVYSDWSSSFDDDLDNVNNKETVWSGDVAAVKVYNSKNADDTAWVVSVMITKTITNGTNTQV